MSALADRILDHPRAAAALVVALPFIALYAVSAFNASADRVATPVMTGIDTTPIDYGASVVPAGSVVERYYPGNATVWRDARGGEWLCSRFDECAHVEGGHVR